MVWRIDFSETAEKQLSKLDRQIAQRISLFLRERVAVLDNPRSIGDALKGSELGEFWKYQVGDWRVISEISEIRDKQILISGLSLGNRREVYR